MSAFCKVSQEQHQEQQEQQQQQLTNSLTAKLAVKNVVGLVYAKVVCSKLTVCYSTVYCISATAYHYA